MKATQVQERIESFVNEEKRTKRATGLTMQVGRLTAERTDGRNPLSSSSSSSSSLLRNSAAMEETAICLYVLSETVQ